MRLTVGPLPPAVYWRRRAVVLGAGLLFLIVLLYSCNGQGNTTANEQRRPSPAPPSAATTPTGPAPSASVLTPQTGAPPAGTQQPAATPQTGNIEAPVVPAEPAVDDGTCADAEMSVKPVALPNSVKQGATVDLQLRIKNVSDRTCSRDVGADLQELFIKLGAETIWSSDTCGTGKGSDVQSFTPGFERSYQLTWNGKDSTRCANGVAAGPYPAAGTYQVFGRLGTKLSEPVKLTIVA